MSDKEVGYLDEFKQQHAMYCAERDKVQTNLNQLLGAIFACEHMIKKIESESTGVKEDGEVKSENQEFAS